MYTWTINCDNGHIDTRDIYRRREELQCIERNVNHHNEYAYMWMRHVSMRSVVEINVGYCHCCTLRFVECNPLQSTPNINDHVMKT